MLEKLLKQKRGPLLEEWRELVFDTYPADSAPFMKNQADRFANPVGHSIAQGLAELFDELAAPGGAHEGGFGDGEGAKKLLAALDGVIRVRSVQSFSPSEAVGIIFLVKDVVRRMLGKEIEAGGLYRELLQFESRVDKLSLLAFETYMQCREDLFEIRTRALKNGPFKLYERGRKNLETGVEVQAPETGRSPGEEG